MNGFLLVSTKKTDSQYLTFKLVYDLRVSLWVLYGFITTEQTFESPIIQFPYVNQQVGTKQYYEVVNKAEDGQGL